MSHYTLPLQMQLMLPGRIPDDPRARCVHVRTHSRVVSSILRPAPGGTGTIQPRRLRLAPYPATASATRVSA